MFLFLTQEIVIVTAVIITTGMSVSSELFYHVLEKKYSFTEAKVECRNRRNGSLPTYPHQQIGIIEEMRDKNISRVWMAMRKKQMIGWKWLKNTSQLDLGDAFKKETEKRCAIIHTPDDLLKPSDCFKRGICFVCRLPDDAICDKKIYLGCTKETNSWITIGPYIRNWYDARKYCRQSGGDLVTIESETDLAGIINEIVRPGTNYKCIEFFVGLRLDEWYTINSLGDWSAEDVKWLPGEPSNEDCAELVITKENNTGLQAIDCLHYSHVICVYYNIEKADGVLQESCLQEKIQIKVWVAGFVLFAIATFMLGIILVYRYRLKDTGQFILHRERSTN